MVYQVKIIDPAGRVKKVISAEEVAAMSDRKWNETKRVMSRKHRPDRPLFRFTCRVCGEEFKSGSGNAKICGALECHKVAARQRTARSKARKGANRG